MEKAPELWICFLLRYDGFGIVSTVSPRNSIGYTDRPSIDVATVTWAR
jgi:hypothetical protein